MKNKRILFFAPNFFGYELQIKKKLENLGASVDFYDDRPSNSTFYKILIRLNPKFLEHHIHNYFTKIIEQNREKKYDYVFFIKCESALENDLDILRKTYPNAMFILYLYDSIKNIKYFDMKKRYFDEIYSFDLEDVKHDQKLKFLPLFYLDCYKKNDKRKEDLKYSYDLSFIGTAHSDRPHIINQIRKDLINNGKTFYFRLYVPSRLIYLVKKFVNKDFRELDKNGHVTLNKISSELVSKIIDESNAVLDIQHPNQSGLTMRTIELLGMRKKIITTNYHIQKYDFFNLNNIAVIERESPLLDKSFFDNKYKQLDYEIYEKYSIESWVKCIFDSL